MIRGRNGSIRHLKVASQRFQPLVADLNASLSLNSLLDFSMDSKSSVVSKLASSSKALLLLSPLASEYRLNKNSPHSCLPLAFSKTFLTSAGTEIVAYFPIVGRCAVTSRCSYKAVSGDRRPLSLQTSPVKSLGRTQTSCLLKVALWSLLVPLTILSIPALWRVTWWWSSSFVSNLLIA